MKLKYALIGIIVGIGFLGIGFQQKIVSFLELGSGGGRVIVAGDLSCTDCIGPTEITDSYLVNDADDTTTGELTVLRFIGSATTGTSTISHPIVLDDNLVAFTVSGSIAGLAQKNFINSTDFAIAQTATGHTHLNAPTGATIGFHINNGTDLMELSASAFTFDVPFIQRSASSTARNLQLQNLFASSTAIIDGLFSAELEKAFVISTSTLSAYQGAGATTTLRIGPAHQNQTFIKAACEISSGTLSVWFGDGTASTTFFQGSTSNPLTFTTLGGTNTFTTGEIRYIAFNPSASVNFSCTYTYK